jgi:MGT family glycosyltransferase
MTRVLVATTPMVSHVRPTLPVVRELAAGGHEVLWYTGPEFGPLAASAGASFVPSSVPAAPARSQPPASLTEFVSERFLRPIPAFAADLAKILDRLAPDVVVADSTFRAAMFEAERRDVARVVLSVAPLNVSSADTAPFGMGLPPPSSLPGRLRNRVRYWRMHNVTGRALQREAQRIRAELGLQPLDGYFIDWMARIADRYLVATVPEFEYPRSDLPPSVRFVGLLGAPGGDAWEQPAWWPELRAARERGQPVVFITQGTITTDPANLLLPAVSALAASDALVVATTSGSDPRELIPAASCPQNLRLAPFIPYSDILPLTDLIVTNGGYGGVQLALSHGVPLVVSGNSEDKMETNMRVLHAGCGVSLGTDRPGVAELTAAAHQVLTDPGYRRNALRLKAAYARYSGAPMAVDNILEVAATPRHPATP